MRVLITVPSLDRSFGGPAVKVGQLAAALRGVGLDVRVVGCGSGQDALGLPIVFRYHGTPVPRSVRPLARLVRHADIVHILGFRDPVGTAAALTARRARVPYVLEPVGMHRARLRSVVMKRAHDSVLGRWIVSGASAVIATSRLEASELEEDGIESAKVRTRANGIDVDGLLPLPAPGTFRQAHGIPQDARLVVSLGRIARKKGLADLVTAIEGVSGMHAAIAGPDDRDGALDEVLRRRASLGLTDRVHVVPRGMWGAEKAQLFSDADVFCLPSATENFGIAAAEAAAAGLPVILTDECGVAEWLQPTSARVISSHDVGALKVALSSLTQGPGVRARAEAAAQGLRAELSWDRLASVQAHIYRVALREYPVGG